MLYIAYRLFKGFRHQNRDHAKNRTMAFLSLFQISFLLMPLTILPRIVDTSLESNLVVGKIVVVFIAALVLILNYVFFGKYIKLDQFHVLDEKYKDVKFNIPSWVFFATPFFNLLFMPAILGTFVPLLY